MRKDRLLFLAAVLFCLISRVWSQENVPAGPDDVPAAGKSGLAAVDGTWVMHDVEDLKTTKTTFGPVGSIFTDVDDDGLPDLLTIFEEGGVRLNFNPGPGDVAKVWPYAKIPPKLTDLDGEGLCAGDMDGDGKVDVILAMGANNGSGSFHQDRRGHVGELTILWGPGGAQARSADAWTAGVIPISTGSGDFNFVRTYDINGDGRPDIVAGGGATQPGHKPDKRMDYPYGGLQWYEAPKDDRRNLANWKRHQINGSYLGSSYGFERIDINGDGFLDFVVIDADADFGGTKPGEQKLVWFANPGDGTEAQRKPWIMHVIYQPETDVFDIKPHIGVGDLNGDGIADVAVQTAQKEILVFLNRDKGARWDRVNIPKPAMTAWKSRFLAIADVDADGHNELLGALSRADWKGGSVDTDRAAIFWMKCENGNDVRPDNWITYPIKRGSGSMGRAGEKWNRLYNFDLDKDGDLDIIANCEEFVQKGLSPLSVQWFEAPFAKDKQAPSVPQGLHVTRISDGVRLNWAPSTDNVGVAGYKIYRDRAFIGYVSNFNGELLTYDDHTEGQHRYSVVAYDAAANSSATCSEAAAK